MANSRVGSSLFVDDDDVLEALSADAGLAEEEKDCVAEAEVARDDVMFVGSACASGESVEGGTAVDEVATLTLAPAEESTG